jgi:tight adherence protein B
MVGEEMPEPIGGEFRITHEEVNFGISLQQALTNLAARIPSTDVRYFIIAVLIQRESGGNLTELLGSLAALIRERFKLLEKVRVLSAEGRLSAWILSLLPFCVAGIINLINPSFMQVLWTDPVGIKMVGTALTAMVFGVLWMRQIIRIHV